MGTFTNSSYTDTIQSLISATESKINNPYYKFSDKKPTPVTYWKQNREKSTLDETTALNYAHVGETSPIKFNQINDFYIYGFERISLDYDVTDFGLEASEISGEAVVLPNTIIPLPGDFFKVTSIKEDVLFKVNKVTPDTMDNGANFYKIEYKLELTESYESILKQVVATYQFVIENVGTDFSCFITSSDYSLASELAELEEYLANAYQIFFDPSVQTFVYEDNSYASSIAYEEDYDETFEAKKDIYSTRRRVIPTGISANNMYDPYLIEFLIRNKVMSYGGEYFFVTQPAATSATFKYDYTKTFFAMIEDPSKFNINRAVRQAVGIKVEDPNSLFVTRLEDYFQIEYFPTFKYATKFNPIDVDIFQHIADGEYYEDGDPKAFFNIWIAYFTGDTGNITTDMLDIIRETDYYNTKEFYYLIPVCMYIIGQYANSLMKTTANTLS